MATSSGGNTWSPAPPIAARCSVATQKPFHSAARPLDDQVGEELGVVGAGTGHDHRRQQLAQLVGVAELGGGLGADPLDGLGVEGAEVALVDGKAPPQLHGSGAALLEGRVVEERVGAGGQDLVGQRRGLGRVDARDLDAARLESGDDLGEALDVHGLVEAVVHRLADERVIGDLDRSGRVLLAADELREDRGHQVVGLHALDRRRVLATAPEAQDDERAVEVPAPAGREHRREDRRLAQHALDRLRRQEPTHGVERERVLRSEAEDDGVVGRRGLQLEVEADAEALAQGEAEAAVDPSAEGSVDDELHAAGLVEEPLEHEVLPGGEAAEGEARGGEVADGHRGGLPVDAGVLHEPVHGPVRFTGGEQSVEALSDLRDLGAELVGAGRRLAQPERHRRRRAVRVDDPYDAGLDAADAPRRRAEEEDVAGGRLDRPVLVHRADERVVGVGEHAVVGGLGDGAAAGERGQAGAPLAPHLAVDGVAVEVGAARAPSGGDAVGGEGDDLVEVLPRQRGER